MRCPVPCTRYGSVIAVRPQASSLRCAQPLIRRFAPPSPAGRRDAERVHVSIGAVQCSPSGTLRCTRRAGWRPAQRGPTSPLQRSPQDPHPRPWAGLRLAQPTSHHGGHATELSRAQRSASFRLTGVRQPQAELQGWPRDRIATFGRIPNPGPGPRAQRSGVRRRARQCRANAPPHPESRLWINPASPPPAGAQAGAPARHRRPHASSTRVRRRQCRR